MSQPEYLNDLEFQPEHDATYTTSSGKPIFYDTLFPYGEGDSKDVAECFGMLCQQLGVKFVRTNATKHGNTEIVMYRADV